VPATGRITFVTLDDTGLEVGVMWETLGETIRAEADSIAAALVRTAAESVVEQHLAHLQRDGYIIGEPPPGGDEE
jgi:hypothetical protein